MEALAPPPRAFISWLDEADPPLPSAFMSWFVEPAVPPPKAFINGLGEPAPAPPARRGLIIEGYMINVGLLRIRMDG